MLKTRYLVVLIADDPFTGDGAFAPSPAEAGG